MTKIAIRPTTDVDFGEIARIFYDAVHQLGRQTYTAEQLDAWAPAPASPDHWKSRTADLVVCVGILGDQIAGFIGFSHSGYVDLLFTRPQFARHGVASALLHHAEQQLRTAEVERAVSDVSRVARPFFEKMGYAVDREQKVNCRGIELTNFRMSKSLRPVCAG